MEVEHIEAIPNSPLNNLQTCSLVLHIARVWVKFYVQIIILSKLGYTRKMLSNTRYIYRLFNANFLSLEIEEGCHTNMHNK